jgi:hypothetical protein
MSELLEERIAQKSLRWGMMASASATVLLMACGASASSNNSDRPTVWIELGANLNRVDGGNERFAPDFVSQIDAHTFSSPLDLQRSSRYANGYEGKLTLQPAESDWLVSVSVRYGRSNGSKQVHQQTLPASPVIIESIPALSFYANPQVPASAQRFASTTASNRSSQLIVDFQAGRDVGLGLFSRNSSSNVNFGVRFAQFTSRSSARISADPDFGVSYKYASTAFNYFTGYFKVPVQKWHVYTARAQAIRSFHGIGPSASWDTSIPLVGNPDNGEFTFDWGVNAAVLFGRQKAAAQHSTKATYDHHGFGTVSISSTVYNHPSVPTARSRSVVVPNLGGFAGFSLKFPNAKVSLGYRGDFFFGAMDGGIDVRKTYDRNFYGPYATISIGL